MDRDGIAQRLLNTLFITGRVREIDQLTDRTRRVAIEGEMLGGLAWTPGQHVRVLVKEPTSAANWKRPRDFLRTYSVWNLADGVLDLAVLDHGHAPGTQWLSGLVAGRPVSFRRPEGSFTARAARYHLFAGEETAAVAFGAMIRALPGDADVRGVIEVDGPADRLELSRDVRWTYRHGRPAAASEDLAAAVAKLDLPDEPGVAYLAGEARTIQLVRRHLVTERGWPRRNVVTKPFWTPGKRGLD